MSNSDNNKKSPRNGAKSPRNPAFNMREERPIRSHPDPLSRSRDPFEGVDMGPRTMSRPATALKERQTGRQPLISARPVADEEDDLRAPSSRAAASVERAHSFAEPPMRRRAYPPNGYARGRGFDAIPRGPWLAVGVAAVSLVIIYMLWSQPAGIRFSSYPGRPGVPATGLPQVNPDDYPQLNIPPGESSVVGPPTISAANVDAILAQYGSPAAGSGAVWVDFGIRYRIDPAYAVAFFIHESGAGTASGWAGFKPDGTTTHNVGNIICAGYPTCFNRFRDYPNWESGIEDWYKLISVEYIEGRGAHTVEQIIPIYAPSFENDVSRYITAVNDLVRSWRTEGVR